MWLSLKAILRWTLPIFTSLLLVASCTVQKRLYTKGYAIDWHKKLRETQGKQEVISISNDPSEAILPMDSVSSTDNSLEIPAPQPKQGSFCNDSAQVATLVHQNQETVLQKKLHLIHKISPLPDTRKEKPPREPKPPRQRIREVGISFFDDAFFYTDVGVVLLLASLLFIFLLSVTTTVTGLANIFLVLTIISLTCMTTFLAYVILFLFFGLCYMLVFWIWKLIYKRKKRIYDEWVDAHPG